MARHDFSPQTIRMLQVRAACHCSNPDCRTIAIEPSSDEEKQTNFGEAAHLAAASEGGPRYDAGMSDAQRSAPDNGIWLCCNCHTKVDKDPDRYSINVLRAWKQEHEEWVRASGDAARLPRISVSSIDGLTSPPSGVEDISGGDAARLREFKLLVEFDRHGTVRELELECQLPEAVCWSRFYSRPAGCEVTFEPESLELIASGAGVKVIGGAPPVLRWRLRVGTPHGRTKVDLRFRVTVRRSVP